MDRVSLVTWARLVGGASLAALLLYGGASLREGGLSGSQAALVVAVTLVGAVAATWALVWLEASRAADLVALVLLGLAPVVTFAGWFLLANPVGVIAGLLWLNLVVGIGETGLLVRLLLGAGASAPARRVARVP